jgi:hypothetical protein
MSNLPPMPEPEHAETNTPMELHPGCEHACQQAQDYGVWPEHSCRPVCVYLAALSKSEQIK